MTIGNARQSYKRLNRKPRKLLRTVLFAAAILAVVAGGMFAAARMRDSARRQQSLLQLWNEGAYTAVFGESSRQLADAPLDFFLLSIHGFSAYQLAIAQINAEDTQKYGDECILSLRKALLCKEGARDGSIRYVLGKAYFGKGSGYTDLAVKYLEEARALSYKANDIPEYLGLAYAAALDYRKSVEAFSEALPIGGEPADDNADGEAETDGSETAGGEADGSETASLEKPAVEKPAGEQAASLEKPTGEKAAGGSDILLLAIARSYFELGDMDNAQAYLTRCVGISKDFPVTASARLLLAKVLLARDDEAGAERQYLQIIEEGGEHADARYELGVLYAGRGETIKARAEWRKAIRLDPAHASAIARLNM